MVGAGVVLIPKFPLVEMILFSQVINGVLLPFVLIFMMLLVNKTVPDEGVDQLARLQLRLLDRGRRHDRTDSRAGRNFFTRPAEAQ